MNALVIGGTGIVGVRLVELLYKSGFNVYVISYGAVISSYEKADITEVDRNDVNRFTSVIDKLNSTVQKWDLVVDLVPFSSNQCKLLDDLIGDISDHVIILSTTLVYDRSQKTSHSITETNPLSTHGKLGGYVDRKLDVEEYWMSSNNCQWTILRPYHILGRYSFIGCAPLHNRDPELLNKLISGQNIELAGNLSRQISYIHPDDLCEFIVRLCGNEGAKCNVYNAVYPYSVSVIDYYKSLSDIIGHDLNVKKVSLEEYKTLDYGWELTMLPHAYSGNALYKASGYEPLKSIITCLNDAIKYRPFDELRSSYVHKRMNLLPKPNINDLVRYANN